MTKTEHAVLINVIDKLKGNGRASDEINEILANHNFRLWLDTWVVPPLELIVPSTFRDPDLALSLSR